MCTDCPYIIDGVAVKEEMCEDCMPEQKSLKQKSKKKKSTKITRRESYRRHLKKLCENYRAYSVWLHYPDRTKMDNGFYVNKSYGRSDYVRAYKHYSNKKIRLYNKSYIPKGQWCKKLFDFWWTID